MVSDECRSRATHPIASTACNMESRSRPPEITLFDVNAMLCYAMLQAAAKRIRHASSVAAGSLLKSIKLIRSLKAAFASAKEYTAG